ncbi:uncharacterized protein LOC130712971 [Lotus japonicus]|uniref:uncharacterized protein LOC130712971 n=1 Tax=Lotus japonicus TaxID=34305 RepID=UPI002586725B|nr:uncharacterized protein LOC130712971 [Lotus japonicus]
MGEGQKAPPKALEDLWETGKIKVDYVNDNRQLPKLYVDKSVIDNMCSPWKNALVVGLLGKRLGYRTMKSRLSSIWQLVGEFDLLDIDNGFYMVKFDRDEDRKKVMDGGPWMIFDHYLVVALWSKEFISPAAKITKTMAWIRVPGLNVTFYDESFLMSLAKLIGTPVRVDMTTLNAERGRFARICVELDLMLPVVGKFWFEGFRYKIVYEGLHIICTKCGCYGHRGRECTQPSPPPLREEPIPPPGKETAFTEPPPVDLGAEQASIPILEGAETQEPLEKECATGAEIKEKTPPKTVETDPTILEVAGEWLTVTRKHQKKKPPIKGGEPHVSKSFGTAKESQRAKGHVKQTFGSARSRPVGNDAKKSTGPFVGSLSGPATVKAPGGKKRRTKEDPTRVWGVNVFMQKSHEGLANGVFSAGTGAPEGQPEMLLLKTGGASQIKKLGSNLEGPFEPSGQKVIHN